MSKASDQVSELNRRLRGATRSAQGLTRALPDIPRSAAPLATIAAEIRRLRRHMPRDSVRFTFRKAGL